MADTIPIFPLELILFPSENLNLHIFEERYRQLIKDANDQKFEFGIPYFMKGKEMVYGCTAILKSITRTYEDGRMDIKTVGSKVFRIHQLHKHSEDKLYSSATIDFIDNNNEYDIVATTKLSALIADLYKFMNITKPIPEIETPMFSYLVGHHVGLSKEQELELLSINSEEARQGYLIEHLTELLPVVKEMESLRKKVEMNGHFKNLKPPLF